MNAKVLAPVAIAFGLVCGPTDVTGQSGRPEEEPLWVGVLEDDGNLIPIARYKTGQPGTEKEGDWDEPWPELFDFAALRFDRHTGTPLIVDIPRWRPNQEARSGWKRTETAPVRWYVHSPGELVTPIDATSLTITHAHCEMAWKLHVGETPDVRALLRHPGDRRQRFVGPAFSRPADAVVDESEIPALDQIRRDLNLVDRPESERDRPGIYTGGDYTWLGFHRFRNLVLGVAFGTFYEGEAYFIVEIDGDRGRIAATVTGGGC